MSELLTQLKNRGLLWQATQGAVDPSLHGKTTVRASHYDRLDDQLKGGWPAHGVVKIRSPMGVGELRLLLPALLDSERSCVLINPPASLCAEFFYHQGFDLGKILLVNTQTHKEALWAAEQCAKSAACDMIVFWQSALEVAQVKRLLLAAEQGDCLLCCMDVRTNSRIDQSGSRISLPLTLSLSCTPSPQGLNVRIEKRKGGWALEEFVLSFKERWPYLQSPQKVYALPQRQAQINHGA